MALTRVPSELSSTPSISDSGDATAITIGSDESVDFAKGIVVEGSGTTAGVYLNGTNSDTATQGNFVRFGTNFATQSNAANDVLITKAYNGSTFVDALSVKSDGNVGIGTTNPSVELHVNSSDQNALKVEVATAINQIELKNNSGSPTYITQDSFGLQIKADENGFGGTASFFSVKVKASERMRINSSGNMGIGADPDTTHRLRLTAGTGGARCLNMSVGNSGLCATTNNVSGTASYDAFAFTSSGGSTQVGGIAVFGTATSFNTSSDYRLKENVDYTWDATTRLEQLRPARFNWIIDDTNTLVDGFLAHEVEDIVPEAITGEKDATKTYTNVVRTAGGLVLAEGITEAEWTAGKANAVLWTEEDELPDGVSVGDVRVESTYPSDSTWDASLTKDVYQAIDQSKLVPLLVKALQESNAKIEALETRIETLENA